MQKILDLKKIDVSFEKFVEFRNNSKFDKAFSG